MKNLARTFASTIGLPMLLIAGNPADAQTKPTEKSDKLNITQRLRETNRAKPQRPLVFSLGNSPTHPPYGYLAFCFQMPAHQVEDVRNGVIYPTGKVRTECKPPLPNDPRQFSIDTATREGKANLYTLKAVNDYVNTIKPKEDMVNYGITEFWTYPNDSADCEDYVLLKKYILSFIGVYLRNPTGNHEALRKRGIDLDFMAYTVNELKRRGVNMKRISHNTITEASLRISLVLDTENVGHAILIGKTFQKRDIALDNMDKQALFWAQLPYTPNKSHSEDPLAWYEAEISPAQ